MTRGRRWLTIGSAVASVAAAAAVGVVVWRGCVPAERKSAPAAEICRPVAEAMTAIGLLERGEGVSFVRLDVRKTGAPAVKFRLQDLARGRDLHLWLTGEHDWLAVTRPIGSRVSLAKAMDALAESESTVSAAELFASYAGTWQDVAPAFDAKLEGDVLPEWFTSREPPRIDWLDCAGVDADILKSFKSRMTACRQARLTLLAGNVASQAEKAQEAVDMWAAGRAVNPRDPLLEERLEHLKANAKVFYKLGKKQLGDICVQTIKAICR